MQSNVIHRVLFFFACIPWITVTSTTIISQKKKKDSWISRQINTRIIFLWSVTNIKIALNVLGFHLWLSVMHVEHTTKVGSLHSEMWLTQSIMANSTNITSTVSSLWLGEQANVAQCWARNTELWSRPTLILDIGWNASIWPQTCNFYTNSLSNLWLMVTF